MTAIYFVRHAHCYYNADEVNRPLSSKGIEHRDCATRLFENKNIHTIYLSSYKRAIQMVEGIAQKHKLQLKMILIPLKKEYYLMEIYLILTLPFMKYEVIRISHLRVENPMKLQKNELLPPCKKIILTLPNDNIAIGKHVNIMVLMMQYLDVFKKIFNA